MKTENNVIITDDFTVECIGEHEEYVYDIEVEETHSFFANNILVHNSVYYHIEPFVNKKFGGDDKANAHNPEVVDWCDRFEQQVIQPIIKDTIKQYSEVLNIFDEDKIGVEREIIADAAVLVAKKKYFARVLDSEGVRYDLNDPYIKIMGLEIAKSSTPKWVKMKLEESIGVILDQDQAGVRAWRDKTRLEFLDQDIEDISMVQGISSLDYNLGDKGVPQGSKSALSHNAWVMQQGLEDEIPLLQAGEKYKRCYIKEPNRFGAEILSYADSKIPHIIKKDGIYDYSRNFKVQLEQPLERMVSCMGYRIEDVPMFNNLEDW